MDGSNLKKATLKQVKSFLEWYDLSDFEQDSVLFGTCAAELLIPHLRQFEFGFSPLSNLKFASKCISTQTHCQNIEGGT